MKVDPYRYNRAMGRIQNEKGEWENGKKEEYPAPDATAAAHESLQGAWRAIQLLPKSLDYWEKDKHRRTIKAEKDRPRRVEPGKKPPARGQNPLLVHQGVLDRMNAGYVETITTPNSEEEYPKKEYRPENLLESLPEADPRGLTDDSIEQTLAEGQVFGSEGAG